MGNLSAQCLGDKGQKHCKELMGGTSGYSDLKRLVNSPSKTQNIQVANKHMKICSTYLED